MSHTIDISGKKGQRLFCVNLLVLYISLDCIAQIISSFFPSINVAYLFYTISSLIFLLSVLNIRHINCESLCVEAVIIISQLLGFLYSNNLVNFQNNNFHLIVIWTFNFFILFMYAKSNEIFLNDVFTVFNLIIIIAIVATLYEFFFDLKSLAGLCKVLYIDHDLNSFFSQRNGYGFLLALAVISCIFMYLQNKYKLRYFLIGIYLLFNLAIVFSRDSYLTVIVFVLVYFIFNIKKRHIQFGIFCTVLIALILLYCNIPTIKLFVDQKMIRQSAGLTGRNQLWETAMSTLDVPTVIFGRGLGASQAILQDSKISTAGFHNMYLNMIVSGGLVLCCVFLYVMFYAFRGCIAIMKTDQELGALFLAIIVSNLTHAGFELDDIFNAYFTSVLWTILSVSLPILLSNEFSENCDLEQLPECSERFIKNDKKHSQRFVSVARKLPNAADAWGSR